MATTRVRDKSAKGIANAVPDLFIERQDGLWVGIQGRKERLLVRGLTWQEEDRTQTIMQQMISETRAAHKDSAPELEDYDFQVVSTWRLRLGVIDVDGFDVQPEYKEMTIGGQTRKVYSAALFEKMNPAFAKGLLDKIDELTHLSQTEEIKLVFTSPS